MSSLREVAERLVAGEISIDDACRKARDAIVGTKRAFGFGGRVLRSTDEVSSDIAGLSAYINEHSIADPEKWAGTLLMLHVQLAIGDPGLAVRMTRSVVQVSRGTCGPRARPYAVALIDSLLDSVGGIPPAEAEFFRQARQSFER